MLALGTRVGFEELPETVKLLAAVSVSLTANGIGAVGVLTVVPWLPMLETLGAVFEFVELLPDSGRRTKMLKIGPVAGAAVIPPVGVATVNPVMGKFSGWPSKVPL